jgi:hypothetical protein
MFFNAGKLAFFGHADLNGMNQQVPVRESQPVYAENVWQGKHVWKPVDFGPDGTLPLNSLVGQMYEKMFPDAGTRSRPGGIPLREGKPNSKYNVHIVARHPDGTVFLDTWVHNLRTNAGINWQYGQMAGSTAAVCNYIALSNASITPNVTDTTLSSEITANGLSRAGPITSTSYNVHTSNATSFTLQNIFTCATAAQAAQAAAIFNNTYANGGTMCFENTFTQASLQVGDTLTVTWTISF